MIKLLNFCVVMTFKKIVFIFFEGGGVVKMVIISALQALVVGSNPAISNTYGCFISSFI